MPVQVAICESTHKCFEKKLNTYGILYVYAMAGCGKTTQSNVFAEKFYKESRHFSAREEGFLDDVEAYIAAHRKSKLRTLLILDDLHWLGQSDSQKRLFHILVEQIRQRGKLKFLLLSRGGLPDYLVPLQVTEQLGVEDGTSLILQKEQVRELLKAEDKFTELEEHRLSVLIQKILHTTRGYPIATTIYIRKLVEGEYDDIALAQLTQKDVAHYLDTYLLHEWPVPLQNSAIALSIFPTFTTQMAEVLVGESAKEIIAKLRNNACFLTEKVDNSYVFDPFFKTCFHEKLQELSSSIRMSLYEKGAVYYESVREFGEALRCYQGAGRTDKMAELIVYLLENADGSAFAKIASPYLESLPQEWETHDPRLLGAKVMIAAYQMRQEQARTYLARLKELAYEEKKQKGGGLVLETYVRTVIANPCGTAEELKENISLFTSYLTSHGLKLKNILPTGNAASIINGGLDLLAFDKMKTVLYPLLKPAVELFMGDEVVGVADGAIGEILYEQNEKTRAMASLTKALSAANLRGVIRMQYAVTGIMSRLFLAEGQLETSLQILQDVKEKAKACHFLELIPNIEASLTECALYDNDAISYEIWLQKSAPNEHELFYITMRYQLLTKAKVYLCLDRGMEALYIIGLLREYAGQYNRVYLGIQLDILEAIILYRRKESWQEVLTHAVEMATPYKLVRIFADEGAALYPLWQEMQWDAKSKYQATITDELQSMAERYPEYLKGPRQFGSLSDKELAVLRLMAQGRNNTQIAEELFISLGTSKFHTSNVMKKLGANNRTIAVKLAQDAGIL